MSRFDYLKYDDFSASKQAELKAVAQKVEAAILELDRVTAEFRRLIGTHVSDARSAYLAYEAFRSTLSIDFTTRALEAVEVAYMWCGKGLRNAQIARNGSAPLQEERGNE